MRKPEVRRSGSRRLQGIGDAGGPGLPGNPGDRRIAGKTIGRRDVGGFGLPGNQEDRRIAEKTIGGRVWDTVKSGGAADCKENGRRESLGYRETRRAAKRRGTAGKG